MRSGLFRVVQLTLLGSMLTNLLFVFGLSCLVGGFQWQVQQIRITSGNTSIGMLLAATMGLVLPAALKLGNESLNAGNNHDELTESDIQFSRVNALVMATGYVCYLIFQLGSHKEEFDYDGDDYAAFGGGHNIVRTPHFDSNPKKPVAKPNLFCRRHCFFMKYCPEVEVSASETEPLRETENFDDDGTDMEMMESVGVPQRSILKRTALQSLDMQSSARHVGFSSNGVHDNKEDVLALRSKSLKEHSSDGGDNDEGKEI